MTPNERKEIRDLAKAKHKGNLDAAICDWLGLSVEFKAAGNEVPNGNAGAVFNIKDELEKLADSDAEHEAAALEAAKAAVAAAGGRSDAGEGADKEKDKE